MATDNFKEYRQTVKDAQDLAKSLQKDIKNALYLGLEGSLKKVKDLDGATTKVLKNQKKLYEESIDLTKDILENVENIGTEEFKTLDVATKLAKARRSGDKDLVKQLTHLKSMNQVQKQQNKQIQATANLIKKPFEAMDSFIRQIPVVGELFAEIADFGGVGESLTQGFTEGLVSGMAENADVGKKFGTFLFGGEERKRLLSVIAAHNETALSYKQAKRELKNMNNEAAGMSGRFMNSSIAVKGMTVGVIAVAALAAKAALSMLTFAKDTGLSLNQTIAMGGALAVNADAVRALAEELGTVNNLTTAQALTLKLHEIRYGLSAESAAKLFAVERSISGASMDTFLASAKTTAELARQAGVAPKAIFDDMAENAELIARFSGESTESIRNAAIQAKRMGLSLSATGKIAENLLDFETSIGNEMEVSMLLGRTINLDKARALMFDGKMSEMQNEVINQLRTIGNFNELNIVQKDALAKLTGLEVNQLAKMSDPTLAAADAAEKQKAQLIGAMAAGAAAGAILLGVIMAAKAVFSGGISLVKDIGLAAGGAAAGAGIGGGIGAAGGAIYASVANGAFGANIPQLSTGAVIVGEKGPEVVAPLPAGGVKVDNRKMESLLGQMLVQYEFLMNRLTSKVDGLALSS